MDDPRHILTPSQLNTLARDLLEGAFPLVLVEGEIGNLSRPGSGHLYFTLKDARAQIKLALACRHRVARDDAQTKIGLPEVMLGLIPGWGGTQRLPRLVGLRQALRMILEGATLNASKAAAASKSQWAPTRRRLR